MQLMKLPHQQQPWVKVEHILFKVNLSKLLNIVKWVNLMIKQKQTVVVNEGFIKMAGPDCVNEKCKNPLCDCDPCDCTEESFCICCHMWNGESTGESTGD